MPYSSPRRPNLPSIPQTLYQIIIIPWPNFDPIYQVILLQNSNEWNLSPTKEGSSKKREEQGLKSKRGETSFEKIHISKKREDEIYKLLERFYQKKERREITFSYSAKSDVWPHPYPHIICICTTFYSLTFSFSYLLSIHHSPSTMIICHTNSLEFSFAFTIYKV
jgi:hypothetical protein